jgi:hypothetical protein
MSSMNPMKAYSIVGGVREPENYREYLEACAYMLKTGLYLSAPGHIGRGLAQLLEEGLIDTEGNVYHEE